MNKISLKSVNCADQITSYFIKKRLLLTGFNSTPNELLFGKLKPNQTTKSDKKNESNTKPFEIQSTLVLVVNRLPIKRIAPPPIN